jgi:hypothetical protein
MTVVKNSCRPLGNYSGTNPSAQPAKEVLGVERIAVIADGGYFNVEDIEACKKAGNALDQE